MPFRDPKAALAYRKRWLAEKREAGVCASCPKWNEGYVQCRACRLKASARYHRRKQERA